MKLPLRLQVIAAMVGMHSRDFSIGWANGMVRWEGRVRIRDQAAFGPISCDECGWWKTFDPPSSDFHLAENLFPRGSVKWAASEAAVTFMKELDP